MTDHVADAQCERGSTNPDDHTDYGCHCRERALEREKKDWIDRCYGAEERERALEADRDAWQARYITSAKVRDQLEEEKDALKDCRDPLDPCGGCVACREGMWFNEVHLREERDARTRTLEAIVARLCEAIMISHGDSHMGWLKDCTASACVARRKALADLPTQAQEAVGQKETP